MNTEKTTGFQVPNLERGLQILEYMAGDDREFSISLISRELEFPMNSVMRIMNALAHHGYVHRNPDTKGYTLTNKMVTIFAGRASQKNLMEQSLDVMRDLRDASTETVVISVLDHDEGLILEQVQGLHPFRFVCDPGTRQAIHCSASTKAILAFMTEDERKPMLERIVFEPLTDASITSREDFLAELAHVAKKGYGLDRAEALDGVHCVAAPIFNAAGNPVAAITVTGPSSRLSLEDLAALGATVRDQTRKISERLGYAG